MAFFAAQFITGLSSGAALFLVASGLTLIFGVTRIVNFAHGSLFMLGAYVGVTILEALPPTPAGFLFGVLGAAVGTAALGAALEIALLRRLYRAPELLQLLATFGVLLIVQDATLALWGPVDLTLRRPAWLRAFVSVLGERLPAYDLYLLAAGPLVMGGLWLLTRRTRWGVLIRAAAENRDMVAALGVSQRWLFTSVFALGAGLAGLGGALSLPDGSANLQMDLQAVTDAFVIVVIGGLGSVPGAFLASLLVGVLQAFGIVLFPAMTLVLVFTVMTAVLALRPNGLLGRTLPPVTGLAERPSVIRSAGWRQRTLASLGLALAAAAPLLIGPYALSVLTEALIAILFAASLHLAMGPGGMPSFGHAAWFAIGAYATALAARSLLAPMTPSLVLAALVAGICALLFGRLVARRSGVTLAMLSLAVAQIVFAGATQWVAVTGGDNGILSVWPDRWATTPAVFYWLTLAVAAGCLSWLRMIIFSPFGYALRACRDAEAQAEAIGLDPAQLRAVAIGISGAVAGLSGGFFTFAKGSVFPGVASIPMSVEALLMVLLGGVQSVSGPILGALAFTEMKGFLIVATGYWRAWLGAAILALVLFFPRGLAGARRQ